MKAYKTYLVLLFALPLIICVNCKHNEEKPSFVIKNELDKEIVIQFSLLGPIIQDTCCMKPSTSFEYSELIHSRVVFSKNEKSFEGIWELMNNHPNDTLYIGVFYLDDIVSMSCEEFEQLFPIKKEWKETLSQMEDIDWFLEYNP